MVEHQRLNSPAVTFSASLHTFMTAIASEVNARLQTGEGAGLLNNLEDRIGALRRQFLQSEWVRCTSAPQNPVIILTLKEEHVHERRLWRIEQETLLQECVDQVSCQKSCMIATGSALINTRRPSPATVFLSHASQICHYWKAGLHGIWARNGCLCQRSQFASIRHCLKKAS